MHDLLELPRRLSTRPDKAGIMKTTPKNVRIRVTVGRCVIRNYDIAKPLIVLQEIISGINNHETNSLF